MASAISNVPSASTRTPNVHPLVLCEALAIHPARSSVHSRTGCPTRRRNPHSSSSRWTGCGHGTSPFTTLTRLLAYEVTSNPACAQLALQSRHCCLIVLALFRLCDSEHGQPFSLASSSPPLYAFRSIPLVLVLVALLVHIRAPLQYPESRERTTCMPRTEYKTPPPQLYCSSYNREPRRSFYDPFHLPLRIASRGEKLNRSVTWLERRATWPTSMS